MTKDEIVIQLHNLARITTDIGISKELRNLADSLSYLIKIEKQVSESWKSL
jgi:hypothetical protein